MKLYELPNLALQYGYFLLKISGRHPFMNKTAYLWATFLIQASIFVSMAVSLQQIFVNVDIESFVENLEAIGIFVLIESKLIVPTLRKQNFIFFKEAAANFWPLSYCNESKAKSLSDILRTSINTQKTFFKLSIFAAVCTALSPFLVKGKVLPFGTCSQFKNDFLIKVTIQTIQTIFIPSWLCLVIGIDCLFMGISANIVVQLKVLNETFRNMKLQSLKSQRDLRVFQTKLKMIVDQHNFIMGYCRTLGATYSPIFLLQFVTSIAVISAEMFMISKGGVKLGLILKSIMLYFVLFSQACIYCWLANLISIEAIKISQSAFQIDWYGRYFPQIQKDLIIIMRQAQKPITFMAGGMIDINTQTIVAVLKVSVSICTLLQVLRDG